MKENFDLIFFDVDGTLTDSSEGIIKCVQYALSKYGITENDTENLCRFIGPPLIDSFMNFYGFSREDAIRARNIFNERYLPIGWMENHPYPGIEKVLEELSKSGKMLGVATSKPDGVATQVLEHFGLKKFFPIFCAAPDNGIGGEKAGRVRAALEEAKALGCKVEHPVMVVLGVAHVHARLIRRRVGRDGIHAPVDENAELRVTPPLRRRSPVERLPVRLILFGVSRRQKRRPNHAQQTDTHSHFSFSIIIARKRPMSPSVKPQSFT